jgi:hypothetical protein
MLSERKLGDQFAYPPDGVATRTFVRTELLALKLDLTVRMGVIGAATVAILAGIKFFV